MDVRCEKCQTVYEFDDARVTEAGVTVKCTQCGNLFRVRRRATYPNIATSQVTPAPQPAPARPAPASPSVTPRPSAGSGPSRLPPEERQWMLRSASTGETRKFRELTTLQQWIVERRVSREDEISKSGDNWKKLGGIAELSSFFQVVDQASGLHQIPVLPSDDEGRRRTTAPYLPTPAAVASVPPARPATPVPPPASPPPAARSHGEGQRITGPMPMAFAETLPGDEQSDLVPQLQAMEKQRDAGHPEPLGPPPAGPRRGRPLVTDEVTSPFPAMQRAPRPARSDETEDVKVPPADDDDEDFAPGLGRRRRKRGASGGGAGRVVALVIALVAVAGGAFAVYKSGLLGGSKTSRTVESMQRGRQHLLADSDDGLHLAEQEFQKAHGADEADAGPVAALAEVNALWSWYLAEDARASKDAGRAAELRKSAQLRLDDARRYAGEAVQMAPADGDANRGMATYLLASGAPAASIDPYLTRAADKRADDPAVAWLRGALAFRDGRPDEARAHLEAANRFAQKRTQKDLVRADWLLARAALAANQPDDARAAARRALQANPKHERTQALLEQLDAVVVAPPTPPPATPTVTPTPPVAAVAPTPAPPPVPEKPETAEKPATPDKSAKPEKSDKPEKLAADPKGFDQMLATANRLAEHGRSKEALKLYEKALNERPDSVEALMGIGYANLDTERYAAAVDRFRDVLRLSPSHHDALIGLAECYKVRGDKARALEYYRRYVAEAPSGSKIGMAKSNVRDLEQALKQDEKPKVQVHETPVPATGNEPPP